jgi:acyl dehydratase
MTVTRIQDVEFGTELAPFEPDTSLSAVAPFAAAVGWGDGGGRFSDHERARTQGLPGALVPGIMAMGFLTTMIHRWAPAGRVQHVDTVFRAPLLADEPCHISAVVTDIDENQGLVELDLSVKNEAGETRIFGTARVQLPKG